MEIPKMMRYARRRGRENEIKHILEERGYEVSLKGDDTGFITTLSDMEGVNSAVLVSYNGDYMG